MLVDNLPKLPTNTEDLHDINHYNTVQTLEIQAVQTRSWKLRIARELVEMADRAKEDPDYQELIRKIETGVNLSKL